MQYPKTCTICGKDYIAIRSDNVACSRECTEKFNYNKVMQGYICDYCGSKYIANKYNVARYENHYCSGKCHKKAYWEKNRNSHKIINRKVCKLCSTCKEWIPIAEFGNDKSKWDNLSNRCKPCVSKYLKEYRIQYEIDNKEIIIIKRKRYKDSNREEINRKNREYYQTIQGKAVSKSAKANRKIREHKAGRLTPSMVKKVYDKNVKDYEGLTCVYCLKSCEDNWHLEHKIPLCRGGLNVIDNLTIACPTCNLQKARKTDKEFININQTSQ